ncbi:MAG TPA: extracellular solute-binding protein [Jiangellaceae bacterium]|nr:extracellular solute-binding protein [Jiangellaceae bacterium]
MRRASFLAAGIGAALIFAACGGDDEPTAESDEPDATEEPEAEAPEPADLRLWVNGTDTPQEMRDWLVTTFEEQNPGSTLTIEEQAWEGLVERLTTSLASPTETPDVVEVGNTQAPTFTNVGAFLPLTDDQVAELGGSDLLPGFVEAGTADGVVSAVPLYAGSKVVFYRTDIFEEAGVEVPTTLDEFIEVAETLTAASDNPNFSGFYFPGADWRNAVAFIWDAGGDLALQNGDSWEGSLSIPESQAGLEVVEQLFAQSNAPKDGDEAESWIPWCADEIGMLSAPGWAHGVIQDPEAGCPGTPAGDNIGAFALPGSNGPAPVLLGGSNVAISAQSQHPELAYELLKLILSDEFQAQYAQNGLTPAKISLTSEMEDNEINAAAIEAAATAKLTPAAENWASVEGARILEDFFIGIATGGDAAQLSAEADTAITETLN